METATALVKLQEICSRQEKAPADVMALLKKWGVDRENQEEILNKLKAERFIDENRYASAFVRDKIRFDHWGIVKIRFQLNHKGINPDIIAQALKEIDKQEYRQMISRELDKKRKTLKGTSREIWAKLARYGSSRGYEMDVMRDFLEADFGE
ncbi:MAG: RecX family transcriptional regulator [Bacteroidales bacterium]|nr:RecX family transcriptional regulator [Bacteroidales bacterium]